MRRALSSALGAVAALLVTLLGAGCVGDVDVDLTFDSDVRSAVLVVATPERTRVFGVEGGPQRHRVEAATVVETFVLEYPETLEALGLREGALDLAAGEQPGLPLPPPSQIRVRRVEAGLLAAETTLPGMPARLSQLRLRVPSVPECLDGGGCLGRRPLDDALVCRTPCDEPPLPQPPEPPAPVALTPCPEGWILEPAVDGDDVDACAPWPSEERCASGYAQRPGEQSCRRVGAACPAGTFADAPADAEVVYYVDASAPPGGDGSPGQPWAELSELPTTATGTVAVLLAAGVYDLPARVPAQLVLRGACAEQTRLTATVWRGGDLVLSDARLDTLTVSGGRVRLVGVVVDTPNLQAISVRGAALDARDLLVTGAGFAALVVANEGRARLTSARLDGAGVVAQSGGSAHLEDVAVDGARFGLSAQSGGHVFAARASVRGSELACFSASDEGSRFELEDVYCANRLREGSAAGVVIDGARLSGARLSIRGAASVGLAVDAATVELEDVLVRDTGPDPEERRFGTGLQVREAADVTLRRAHLLRSEGFGVLALDSGTRVELVDTRVVEVAGWEIDGERGTGMSVEKGASARLERFRIERSRGMGLNAGEASSIEGSDVHVQEVLPRDSNGAYGRGVEISSASSLDVARLRVEDAKNIGVHILDANTTAVVEDLYVGGTRRSACFSFSCNAGIADGLIVTLQARLELTRFLVDDNGEYGVRLINDSRLAMTDGQVSNNRIGVQIISDDYDLGLLTERVRYSGNEQNMTFLVGE